MSKSSGNHLLMVVIACLNQKGGSGKTTVSTNLAHAFKLDGHNVLLVDSDPQGNTRDWNEANEGEVVPVIGLDRETLPKDLSAVSNGYDWIIIDGAPQVARLSAAAVKAADIIIIPVQPSPYDIWACADLVDIVKARQEVTDGKPLASFLVSRAITNTRLKSEIANALEDYEIPVLKSGTTQRVAYPTTAAEGMTVLTSTDDKAKREIQAIKKEILKLAQENRLS